MQPIQETTNKTKESDLNQLAAKIQHYTEQNQAIFDEKLIVLSDIIIDSFLAQKKGVKSQINSLSQ